MMVWSRVGSGKKNMAIFVGINSFKILGVYRYPPNISSRQPSQGLLSVALPRLFAPTQLLRQELHLLRQELGNLSSSRRRKMMEKVMENVGVL